LDKIRIEFNKIGKWWRKDKEIDIIAINEKEKIVYFCECKWTKRRVRREVLRDLIRKAEEFEWKRNKRREVYLIFSKSGFEFESEEDVLLVDLDMMVKFAERNFRIELITNDDAT